MNADRFLKAVAWGEGQGLETVAVFMFGEVQGLLPVCVPTALRVHVV